MKLRNSVEEYGLVAQLFHWVMLALIGAQYVLAELFDDEPSRKAKYQLVTQHKYIGMTVLMLAVLRLLWRLTNPSPKLPDTLKPYERILANLSHGALYLLMFALPLTGWMMSSAKNNPVGYFGLFNFPSLVTPDKGFADFMHDIHSLLTWALAAMLMLHVLAALKHHFVLKDDVLRRMIPFWHK